MDIKVKPARIYLKTPEQKWLRRGGMAAFLLPLVCVILFAEFIFFDESSTGAIGIDLLGIVTLSAIPLAGAFLAAFLGTREIRKKNQHGFKSKLSFIWIGVKVGFIAHWTIAFLMFLYIWTSMFPGWIDGALGLFLSTAFGVTYITLLVWGFLTLPLSFAGGFIFWFVAVRGSENLMAETFD